MLQGKRLAILLTMTVVVAAIFGIFIWYQQEKIVDLGKQLEASTAELLNTQARVDELKTALDLAKSQIPEENPYQSVQLPEAGVAFDLLKSWKVPVVSNVDDARETNEGVAVRLSVDLGLGREGSIWYKSNDYTPGREATESEVLPAQIIERGGLSGFCQAGSLRDSRLANCKTTVVGGQTYVTFVVGDLYALGGEERVPTFVAIGTMPGSPFSLFNVSLPLLDEPLAPADFEQALQAIEKNELNTFINQSTLNTIGAGEHLVESLVFTKQTALQDYQFAEGETFAFYAPPTWTVTKENNGIFHVKTSDFSTPAGKGIWISVSINEDLGHGTYGPLKEESKRVINGEVWNVRVYEGTGIENEVPLTDDIIIVTEHDGQPYMIEAMTAAANTDLLKAFYQLVDSFYWTD